MENFLIYVSKASALLGIFYLGYFFLLKKETSFILNRKFLLAGLFTSFLLPLIYFTKKVYLEATPINYSISDIPFETGSVPMENSIDWWQILGIIYLIIIGFFILRLSLQLSSVLKVIRLSNGEKKSGLKFVEITEDQLPFSFFNYIVYNPEKHSNPDLRLILEHEKIHAYQLHSADIILANLVCCILWINPFSWLYKKAVEQNLEFIADRETVTNKIKIKDYQHALVKVSVSNLKPALTNHFYQSFIKKRILMLNKKSSVHSPAWKLSLLIPLILAFMLFFNVKSEAHILEESEVPVLQVQSADNSNNDVELIVTKESSQENLENLIKILKKFQVKVFYEDLKFQEGNLTNIVMSFEDLETGNSGRIHQENEKGIKGFIFTKSKDKIGFGDLSENNKESKKIAVETENVSFDQGKIAENPLYLVNGKTFDAAELKAKYIGYSSTPVILSPDKASKKYGKVAKGGAVVVEDGAIIRDFNKEMDKIRSGKSKFNGKYIAINSDGKPNFMNINIESNSESVEIIYKNSNNEETRISGKSGKVTHVDKKSNRQYVTGNNNLKWIVVDSSKISNGTGAITKTSSMTIKKTGSGNKSFSKSDHEDESKELITDGNRFPEFLQGSKPLIVINKETKEKGFDLNAIEPDNIAKVNVLKGKKATRKYGIKAGEGVIEILTKDFMGDKVHPLKTDFFVLNKESSDKSIENLKKMIKSGADIETEFTNIERNADGNITAISISAKTSNGKKASASFQNSEGIPMVIIGISKDGKLIVSSNYNR